METMETTGYKLFMENNRLTIVIDNPTQETVEIVMKLFGAGIKDLTGLDPVKQEPLTIPTKNPDAEITPVSQETVENQPDNKEDVPTKPEETEEERKKRLSGGYTYQDICQIVKSNAKIVEMGPYNVAIAIHPYLTGEEIQSVLVSCGKTKEQLEEEGINAALVDIVNSKKVVQLANGYVRIIRAREKKEN